MVNTIGDRHKSINRHSESGTMYRAVAYTDGEYAPDKPTDPTNAFRGFICGVAGNVEIVGLDGETCVLPAMAAGVLHPCAGLKILENLTVATGIVAVF